MYVRIQIVMNCDDLNKPPFIQIRVSFQLPVMFH